MVVEEEQAGGVEVMGVLPHGVLAGVVLSVRAVQLRAHVIVVLDVPVIATVLQEGGEFVQGYGPDLVGDGQWNDALGDAVIQVGRGERDSPPVEREQKFFKSPEVRARVVWGIGFELEPAGGGVGNQPLLVAPEGGTAVEERRSGQLPLLAAAGGLLVGAGAGLAG